MEIVLILKVVVLMLGLVRAAFGAMSQEYDTVIEFTNNTRDPFDDNHKIEQ